LRPVFIADFGTEGIRDGAFEFPNGVAVDERARVYVTDRENNRVQVWGY
jgi:sugar lactone lactonase YvrE